MGSDSTPVSPSSSSNSSYICAICSDTIQTHPGPSKEEAEVIGGGAQGQGSTSSGGTGSISGFGSRPAPWELSIGSGGGVGSSGRGGLFTGYRTRHAVNNPPKASNLVAVPCGHVFHTYCLNKWLASDLPSSNQCPNCRKLVMKSACLFLYPDSYEEEPPRCNNNKSRDSSPSSSPDGNGTSPSPKPTSFKPISPNSKPKIVIKLEVENKALRSKLQSVEADFRIQQTLYELQRQDFTTRQKDHSLLIKSKEDELEKLKEELQAQRLVQAKEIEKLKSDLQSASTHLQAEKSSKANLETNLSTFLRLKMEEAEKSFMDLAMVRSGIGSGAWSQLPGSASSSAFFSPTPDVVPLLSPIITPRFAPVGTGPMPIPTSSSSTRCQGQFTKSLSSLGIGHSHSHNHGHGHRGPNSTVIVSPGSVSASVAPFPCPSKPRPPRRGKKMVYEKTFPAGDMDEEDVVEVPDDSPSSCSSDDDENFDIMSGGPNGICGPIAECMSRKRKLLMRPAISGSSGGFGKHFKLRKMNPGTGSAGVTASSAGSIGFAADFSLSMSPITISSDSEPDASTGSSRSSASASVTLPDQGSNSNCTNGVGTRGINENDSAEADTSSSSLLSSGDIGGDAESPEHNNSHNNSIDTENSMETENSE